MVSNKQSVRSLVAFLVTWAFVILTVSGIVLYIVPQGRIAYWVHWQLWGLEKEDWGHLHMIFGALFIVTGALHLYYNWKPFRKYLSERVAGHLQMSRELVASLVLSLLILAAAILQLPPVSWVFDLNEAVKDAWVDSPDLEPPFGHAEEVSLAALARRMDLDLGRAEQALREAGYQFTDRRDSLETIARANATTPMAVYAVVRRYRAAVPERDTAPQAWSAEAIEAKFAGTGLGRKGVDEAAAAADLDPDVARQRLERAGIVHAAGETLREIAERRQMSPIDLMKIMLLPPRQP